MYSCSCHSKHSKRRIWIMYILLFPCNYNDWEPINNDTQDMWTTFIVLGVLLATWKFEFFLLCFIEERHMVFGTTWGWVNNDNISIFGWLILLKKQAFKSFSSWFFFHAVQLHLFSLLLHRFSQSWARNSHMYPLTKAQTHPNEQTSLAAITFSPSLG